MFIRDNNKIMSCTITDINDKGVADDKYEYFKKALFDTSYLIIYEYNGKYYYPLSLEYRLIDNNILYLTEELKIKSIKKIFQVLTSSMNKEEKWSNKFKLSIIHLKSVPKFSYKLNSMIIDIDEVNHVYE